MVVTFNNAKADEVGDHDHKEPKPTPAAPVVMGYTHDGHGKDESDNSRNNFACHDRCVSFAS